MAMANSDGSIILSTKVDTSGINKGMSQMQGKATSLTKTFSKLGAAIASAFAIQKIIQFSNESGQLATQTEASVQRLVDIYGSASDSVGDFIDANARALGMSKAAAASFSSVYGNLFSVWADQATNAELTNRYLNMTAVVASKTGRTVEDVQERVRSGLLGNTEAIEDLGIFVNVKTIEMTDAFQRMADGKSWEQLDAYTQQQIRSMAILEQATAKYGDEVADTSATIRNRFNAAYQDFQNSWGNIVNTVLLPVLETLTQIFDIATKGLNVLSGRSGEILENAQSQESNAEQTADNITAQADAQKDLNKEMKKTLAGFDDIQILSAQTAGNTSAGATSGGFDGLGDTGGGDSTDTQGISSTLTALMGVVGLFLAALGVILMFTGHIGWGIGFLIAGAATLGVTMATLGDDTVSQKTKDALSNALIIAGIVAVVLGIILCMAQQWGIGIGLIVLGATSIVAPIVLNWNAISERIKNFFAENEKAIASASIGLIVLGILLCLGQQWAIGIGLIAAGAVGLGGVVAVNWNAIVDWVKGVWNAVKQFWNAHIAPVFTAKFWLDLAKGAANGLIDGFEKAINGIISMFEKMINWIVDGINSIGFDIPKWLGGGRVGFDIPRVSFGRVSIPRLAQGAVIPPNKEFLAVLGDQKQGTNIEAPLQTIVDAFNIVLANRGGFGGKTEVVLEIDGREFGRAVVEQGNRENRRIGTRLVIA